MQFWHPEYDKFDPYTIRDSHAPLSDEINKGIKAGNLTAVLIAQATIYPQGRMQGAILKGIDPQQTILKLPTADLTTVQGDNYVIIGPAEPLIRWTIGSRTT